jgi:hypothetical protein
MPAAVLYAARKAGCHARREVGRRAGDRGADVRDGLRARGRTASSDRATRTSPRPSGRSAGIVGIDGLAGPSELAIVADATVDPAAAALDLIAQANTTRRPGRSSSPRSRGRIDRVGGALSDALATAGRRDVVEAALAHARDRAGARPVPRGGRSSTPGARNTSSCSSPTPTRSWHSSATPGGVPRARGPRCRSATTAWRPTTSCPPRERRGSRPVSARRTTSRSGRWSR